MRVFSRFKCLDFEIFATMEKSAKTHDFGRKIYKFD